MRRLLRIVPALIVLMLTAAPVQAETHYKSKVWIGGRAGADLSRMSFSPHVKQLWEPGTTGSITVRYAEEKLFGLIAEFGFAQRGWKENYEKLPLSFSRQITYLKLPVMTHIYFGSRRFKGFVNLGPEFGLYLGDTTKSNFDYLKPSSVPGFPATHQTVQFTSKITGKFDYGITAGLGMEYYLHPRHSVVVEGRYYYGLGNIFPSSKSDHFGASRNMTIEITLGYNFRLK